MGRNSEIIVRSIETGEHIRTEGKKRSHVPEPIKKSVWARDGLCCRYCGYQNRNSTKFVLDHVHPWSLGGEHTQGNLVVACRRCNSRKGKQLGWSPLPVKEARAVRYIARQYGRGWRWLPDKRCLPESVAKRMVR